MRRINAASSFMTVIMGLMGYWDTGIMGFMGYWDFTILRFGGFKI
jgi:hypothetical protein